MSHAPHGNTHSAYRHKELHTHTHMPIPLNNKFIRLPNLNQSVVKLLRHQTELVHNTQCLHQQTIDALHNIAKSSALQEHVNFINNMPIFKAKDSKFFNEWLDQINKVNSLANNDPYKLALAKSQSSFNKTVSSYPPTLGWNKIKEHLHYNFGSVATRQHAVSILPTNSKSHQKPSKSIFRDFQTFY